MAVTVPIPASPQFLAQLGNSQRAPRQQAILTELRRVILAGDAPPGMTIPLDDVAAQFGVSVIPVRESLKTLIGERLVDHLPRAGYTVARLTVEELQELYVVRGVLEQAAVGAAAARATPEHHELARRAHDELTAALARDDHRAYHRESRRFHLAQVAPAGMLRLQAMLESAWNLTEPYQPMAHVPDVDRNRLHADHQQMLDAFVAGDTDTLLTLTAEHHERLRLAISSLPHSSGLFAPAKATGKV